MILRMDESPEIFGLLSYCLAIEQIRKNNMEEPDDTACSQS